MIEKNTKQKLHLQIKKNLNFFVGGLVTFFWRYVPKYTDFTEPFANLRKTRIFLVSEPKKNFDRLKVFMAKKPEVKVFDMKKYITLNTDASKHSISGIFSQEGNPMIYLSRRQTNTEFNYFNMEKEALAIVWTAISAQQFLIGTDFFWQVIIDH